MIVHGLLVDIRIEIDPDVYSDYVIYEKGKKVLYVRMLKVLYGMMVSSLLYYKKVRMDIEEIVFRVNPYNICVAHRMIKDKQQTLCWHVDGVKSSHIDLSLIHI